MSRRASDPIPQEEEEEEENMAVRWSRFLERPPIAYPGFDCIEAHGSSFSKVFAKRSHSCRADYPDRVCSPAHQEGRYTVEKDIIARPVV